jgi:hypothetical protein
MLVELQMGIVVTTMLVEVVVPELLGEMQFLTLVLV